MKPSAAPAFLILLPLAGLAAPAPAATIDSISADGTTLSLRLSKAEQKTLKAGDVIAVQPRTSTKARLQGRITALSHGKATVAVGAAASKSAFHAGGKVNVASAGATLPLTKAAKPEDPSPIVAPFAADGDVPAAADGKHGQSFEDALTGLAFASPAQIYQARRTRTEAAVGLYSESASTTTGGTSQRYALSGPKLSVAAIVALPSIPHRLSFAIEHSSAEATSKSGLAESTATATAKITETRFTPGLGAAIADAWFAGVGYEIVQKSFAGRLYNGHSLSLSYARPAAGVLWHAPGVEAGLAFQAKVDQVTRLSDHVGNETIESEAGEHEPAVWTAHAQAQVDPTLSAYGRLAVNLNRMRNVDGDDSWKNNATLTAGAEKTMAGGLAAGGALAVDTPAARTEAEKSVDNITTWTIGGDFAKLLGDSGKIGAQLVYTLASAEFHNEGGQKVAVDRDGLALSLTGSVNM